MADWRHAMLMAMVANTARDTKRRPSPFRPDEFLPRWQITSGEAAAEPSDEEVRQAVLAMNAAYGGRSTVH